MSPHPSSCPSPGRSTSDPGMRTKPVTYRATPTRDATPWLALVNALLAALGLALPLPIANAATSLLELVRPKTEIPAQMTELPKHEAAGSALIRRRILSHTDASRPRHRRGRLFFSSFGDRRSFSCGSGEVSVRKRCSGSIAVDPRCLRVSGSLASGSPSDRLVRGRHQAAGAVTTTSDGGSARAGRREGKPVRATACLSPPIH
jgi:hypothetical protein